MKTIKENPGQFCTVVILSIIMILVTINELFNNIKF